ncbi:MAG: histidine kinase [Oscillospiraceae bacterium]|nr:histidine kinase [Oscillospiraceae bacterium]
MSVYFALGTTIPLIAFAVAATMHADLFNDTLRDIEADDGVRFIAFDMMKTTMLTTDESLFTTGIPLSPEVTMQLDNRDEGLFSLYYGGIDFLYYDTFIEDIGWTIVLLMPRENLDREITSIVWTFMPILGSVLLLVVLSIYLFNRVFSKPLIRLVDAMNSADSGNLHAEVEYTSDNEIGQAANSFNNLLQRVRQLVDDVKAEETKKRAAELAALQAQINPHFMSNTLGVARILAQNQKADNIDQLLTALIELLNISMGAGGSLITLKEEVKYVQSYVKIMQYRSFTRSEVNYLIHDSVEECLVPKMILQPLVENALIHGITGSEQPLQIDVRTVVDGDILYLSVIDNGKGITPETIESIMSASPDEFGNRFSSIGLPNVHERVQRIFGDGYGLSIESRINLFTNIEITMPIVRKDGDLLNGT